ncbi:hypothetical protein D9M71_416330 [compost metagenome]
MAVGEQGDEQALDELFLAEDLAGEELAQREKGLTMGHRGNFLDLGNEPGAAGRAPYFTA